MTVVKSQLVQGVCELPGNSAAVIAAALFLGVVAAMSTMPFITLHRA